MANNINTFVPAEMQTPTDVGPRIKEARLARGLNRNQLARYLGTSWALVNQWEKGKTAPSLRSIRRIADVLGVSVDRILGGPEEPTNDEFEEYLRIYLPEDLTEEEQRWLRSAPSPDEQTLSPEGYAAILRVLRAHRRDDSGFRDNVIDFARNGSQAKTS